MLELVPADDFLNWVATKQIGPDMRFDEPRSIVFQHDASDSRFWMPPAEIGRWPAFLKHILVGLAPEFPCFLWPRGGGWTYCEADELDAQTHAADRVRTTILRGAGIKNKNDGAIRACAADLDTVLSILFAQLSFGASVWDDVFVIPEHGRAIIHVEHHDVVHVECTDTVEMQNFIAHMASKGFELPEEPPDRTFKWPSWMKRRTQS